MIDVNYHTIETEVINMEGTGMQKGMQRFLKKYDKTDRRSTFKGKIRKQVNKLVEGKEWPDDSYDKLLSHKKMKHEQDLDHPRIREGDHPTKFGCCCTRIGRLGRWEESVSGFSQELSIGVAIYFRMLKFLVC